MKTDHSKLKTWLRKQNSVNQTYVTQDYSLFKRLNGNRTLNLSHVRRLESSINKHGMLEVDIIINEKGEVIDGQNRLEAAKRVNSVVFFKVCEGYGLREAQILNENVKSWKRIDYLDSYCELGYEPYITFKEFMHKFPKFNFSSCETIILLRSSNKRDTIDGAEISSKYFESGSLNIPNIDKSIDYAQKIMEIEPYFEGYNTITFVRAMMTVFQNSNYDHGDFLRKLQFRGAPILDYRNKVEHYKLLIEEIYNYKRSGKVNLRY